MESLRRRVLDVRHFGPPILRSTLSRSDADGYRTVQTRFGSFLIRPRDTDMQVLRSVFADREYDLDRFPQGRAVRASYEEALRRGKVPLIIDAGANVGFVARFFALSYPQASIVSVEPEPASAALCRANTRSLPQVEVVEAAIGSRSGRVSLQRTDGHAWATRTHRAETGLPVVTIGDLTRGKADVELLIVKVDIEGFELDLFADATEWVADTCAVIVEPHDWMLPDNGSSQTLQKAMLGENRDLLISGGNLVWVKR